MPNGAEEIKKAMYNTKNLPITATEELISYEYYSYLPLSTTGTELQFFGYTIGQLIPGTTTRATKKHTNMTQPNQIPAPYSFLLKEITCDIIPDASTISGGAFIDDYYKIVTEGYFEFQIGSKVYQDGRLLKLAPKSKLLGFAAIDGGSALAQRELVALSGETYKIKPEGITLPSGLTFNFVVKFDTAPGISADTGILITFWGYLKRPAQ
jgi:hypothetical protein